MDDKRFFSRVGFSYSAVTAVVSDCAAGSRSSGYKLAAGYGTAVSGGNPGMCKDDAGAAEHAALPE